MSLKPAFTIGLLTLQFCNTHAASAGHDALGSFGAGGQGPGAGPGSWPYAGTYQSPGGQDNAQIPDSILDYYHALGWVKTYAAKAEARSTAWNSESRDALRQIQSDAQFLQDKWLAWPRLHPSQRPYSGNVKMDAYLRAVEGAEKQLKALDKATPSEAAETVKWVAADLHIKAENCRHSPDGLGKDLKVTVRTKLDSREVGGYEVWCVPIMLLKFKDQYVRFPKMSSPTVAKNFPPGRYAMWLEKDKKKTEPVAQTVGGRGETEFEIDLPIPTDLAR